MDDARLTALIAELDQKNAHALNLLLSAAAELDGVEMSEACGLLLVNMLGRGVDRLSALAGVALLSLTLHRERQQGAFPGGPL